MIVILLLWWCLYMSLSSFSVGLGVLEIIFGPLFLKLRSVSFCCYTLFPTEDKSWSEKRQRGLMCGEKIRGGNISSQFLKWQRLNRFYFFFFAFGFEWWWVVWDFGLCLVGFDEWFEIGLIELWRSSCIGGFNGLGLWLSIESLRDPMGCFFCICGFSDSAFAADDEMSCIPVLCL